MKKYLPILIIVAVSGCIGGGEIDVTNETATSPSTYLEAQSQPLSGNSITIDRAVLQEPGYIVVHANDGGVPGTIIGNSRLLEGEVEDIEVVLEGEITDTVWPMLHTDDGDGEFGQGDAPVTLEDGTVVTYSIDITGTDAPGTDESTGTNDTSQQTGAEEPVQAQVFTVQADDSGFYDTNGNDISTLGVPSGEPVQITFEVGSNVYYGGLDFRSDLFNSPTIDPEDEWTSPEFTADADFTVTSYWPESNVKKADMEVVVS